MRVLICDDEEAIVSVITDTVLMNFPDAFVTGVHSQKELTEVLNKEHEEPYDVIFLDLVLGEDNGVNLGMFISRKFPETKIIFISGFVEKVSEVFFSVRPYGFICKPFDAEIIVRYLNNIIKEAESEANIFDFVFKGKHRSMKINDIVYFESDRNKVIIHGVSDTVFVTDRLDNVEASLPDGFVRCHKSYLVNMRYIHYYNKSSFELINGECINISRSKKNLAEEKYFSYKGGLV